MKEAPDLFADFGLVDKIKEASELVIHVCVGQGDKVNEGVHGVGIFSRAAALAHLLHG